ncbi:MAG: molecular chaperone TorD family protein [Acidobacteriota bacterium]
MSKTKQSNSHFNEGSEKVLYRSTLYGALALAFHSPTGKTFKLLNSDTTRNFIVQAACFLETDFKENPCDDPEPLQEDRPLDFGHSAGAWVSTFSQLDLDALRGDHGRLFGHTARGTVTPYETEYGQQGLFQQPQQLANLTGFYRAFGLKVRQDERERPDHIACQLEFEEFLARKQAYALSQGDDVMLEESQRATRLFMRNHLGRFGRAFGYRLGKADSGGFLGLAGDFLFDFLTLECRRLKIEAGPTSLALRSPEEDNVPMACSSESDLVQIEG